MRRTRRLHTHTHTLNKHSKQLTKTTNSKKTTSNTSRLMPHATTMRPHGNYEHSLGNAGTHRTATQPPEQLSANVFYDNTGPLKELGNKQQSVTL